MMIKVYNNTNWGWERLEKVYKWDVWLIWSTDTWEEKQFDENFN